MSDYNSREAALRDWPLCDEPGDAYQFIRNFPAADVRPKWISVTERLPEAGERVLCYCRANIYEVMKMRTSGDWVYDVDHIYMPSFVTHWMPLPEPPKEG